ncbi:uncharacterized protein LOC111019284 [Momordica charantia]|uniref:Uncharacterized protein LOC111019284 n=1 Tax=Momordica charantia TaxID=3673 RepID=A0A6J1DEA2_MOMCH|nr:uncharacterized protein LOC111019284 [Momordica charantia]
MYYNGLNEATQLVIGASANGALLSKPYAEAFDTPKIISSNKHQWSKSRVASAKTSKRLADDDVVADLNSKISMLVDIMMKNITQHDAEVSKATSQAASLRNMEVEIGKLATELKSGPRTILTSKIPEKMKNSGSFIIPVAIGGQKIRQTLYDLGASINLMPMSIYKKLGIGEARPTMVTLQLASRSITHPEGQIQDVLVEVDKFTFPTDFIILDYDANKEVPIINGRPFLATGRALVDVHKGKVTMRVKYHEIQFSVYDSTKYLAEAEECPVLIILDETLIDILSSKAMLG